MIIKEPNEFVAELHDRMPVLLGEKDFDPWLLRKRMKVPEGQPRDLPHRDIRELVFA
jgi:putative SOS response-associated peptidase YedK